MKKLVGLILILVIIAGAGIAAWQFGWLDSLFENEDSQTYNIRYADASGEIKTVSVTFGEAYSITLPKKDGYIFRGLFDQEEGGVQYVATTGLSVANWNETSDKNLFAVWNAESITILFDSNGGTGTQTNVRVLYDANVPVISATITKTGHNFLGWFSSREENATSYTDGMGTPVKNKMTYANYPVAKESKEITYVAKWEPIPFSVVFHSNETSDKTVTINVPYGGLVADYAPKTADFMPKSTKDGIKGIIKWTNNSASGAPVAVEPVTAERTVYAQWAPAIIFDMAGGEERAVIIAEADAAIVVAPPARVGYDFLGWKHTNGDAVESLATMPAEGASVKASWGLVTYTINYNYNGGTTIETVPTTYTVETPRFTIPTSTTRDHYTFGGWYDDVNLNGSVIEELGEGIAINRNLSLYAKWDPISYTISYDYAGGTTADNRTFYSIETTTFTLNNPARSGYEFAGWAGYGISILETTVSVTKGTTGNLSFTAHWTRPFTVSMNRKNCGVDNGYNYDKANPTGEHETTANMELGNLILTNCVDTASGYSAVPGKTPMIQYQLLQNPAALSKPGVDSAGSFKVDNDSWTGRVKDTNINGKKIGMGAYYVEVTYTDNSTTEKNAVNFLSGASKGGKITLLSASDLTSGKTVKQIDIVAAYEIYRGGPGPVFGIWWHETTNWHCSYTFKF